MTAVSLYAFECGRLTIPHAFMLEGAEGDLTVPIPSYLIKHPKGNVLFDSGFNLAIQSDPEPYITAANLSFTTFHCAPGEEISARLGAVDLAVTDVDLIINSHLHYDHSGGNAQIPNADVLLQRPEWDHAMALPDDDLGYRKVDFDTGQKIRFADAEHDVFGDGSVVAFATPGHTPGHQSLRVRTAGGEFVLCGDACYLRHSLEQDHLPGIVWDRDQALEAFALFRRLEAQGARLMFGHDPDFWSDVPVAPARLG